MTLSLKVNCYFRSIYYINIVILDLNSEEIDNEIFLVSWIQTGILKNTEKNFLTEFLCQEIARDLEFEGQPLMSQFLLFTIISKLKSLTPIMWKLTPRSSW